MIPTKRNLVLTAIVMSVAASVVPAPAKIVGEREITWTARRSCSVTCPWVHAASTGQVGLGTGNANAESCAPRPVSMPESWSDQTEVVPSRIGKFKPTKLIVSLSPVVDWELFVCSVSASGTVSFKSRGKVVTSTCAAEGIGCTETVSIKVKPGQRYLLRAYNVLDPFASVNGTVKYDGVRV